MVVGGPSNAFSIAASGMRAQQTRMGVIARNIANAETTNGPDHEPYHRQDVRFQSLEHGGVRAVVLEDPQPTQSVYEPQHPDAGEDGFVSMPNVDISQELVDLMETKQAYQANAMVMKTANEMFDTLLEIMDRPRWHCPDCGHHH